MAESESARNAARRTRRSILTVLVVVGAALISVTEYGSSKASPSSGPAPVSAKPLAHHPSGSLPRPPAEPPPAAGVADGVVPAGVTIFDTGIPAVANLEPALLGALRQAAGEAASRGIIFYVNSGWRSPKYQEQLLEEAISKYGSKKEAARWVATPTTSAHVSGAAVDIGHSDAAKWLSEHGAGYGLCQIYRNEPWHYELHPEATRQGCPAPYADPTHDPRMQP